MVRSGSTSRRPCGKAAWQKQSPLLATYRTPNSAIITAQQISSAWSIKATSQVTLNLLGWCSSRQMQPASPWLEAGREEQLNLLSTEKQDCYANRETSHRQLHVCFCCCAMLTSGRAWAKQDWPGPARNSTGNLAPSSYLRSNNGSLVENKCDRRQGGHHASPYTTDG